MSSKLREALERSTTRLKGVADCYPEIRHLMQSQIEENDAALAEPLRNCDVGTAEEQYEQFILFCRRNSFRGVCNDSCKFASVSRRLGWQTIGQARCFLFWGQMPYEKGEVK
jgi:hypothetical protein